MALTVPGIDFAWDSGHAPFGEAQRAGIKFVMRYISHDSAKDLTKAEAEEWQRRGIKVGVVFETTTNRALAGYKAGVVDAHFANARCAALGIQPAVYFAVDADVTDAQKPAVASYLDGAVSVLGYSRVGVYGDFYVVKYCSERHVCAWFWQTYAWSGGHVHPATHIYQYHNGITLGGVSCDLNHARNDGPYGCVPSGAKKPDPRVKKRRIWAQHLKDALKKDGALHRRIKKLKRLVAPKKRATP